jgi:hypothetical protein
MAYKRTDFDKRSKNEEDVEEQDLTTKRNGSQKNSKRRKSSKKGSKSSGGRDSSKGGRYPEDGTPRRDERAQDPEDYNWNPQLAETAGNIPVGVPIGYPINLHAHRQFKVPGILTIDVLHGPGTSNADWSAMMLATRQIYADIRVANAGGVNYAAQDLMMYMLQFRELVAWYYNAARAYATMGMADVFNRYKPKALVQALGFDYDNLIANSAAFNYAINNISTRLNAFCVPNKNIFVHTAKMFSNIYTDSQTMKNQAIVFRPAGYRVLDQTGIHGGSLIYHDFDYYSDDPQYHGITVDIFVNIMEDMLRGIEDNSDVAIMCGDIVKRYGSNILRITPIPQFILPDMIHSENVLHQVKNMRWLVKNWIDWESEDTNFDVTQDPTLEGRGLLEYMPTVAWKNDYHVQAGKTTFGNVGYLQSDSAILYFTKDVPSPLEFIEYSRFMFTLQDISATQNKLVLDSFGVDIAVDVCMYTYTDSGLAKDILLPGNLIPSNITQQAVTDRFRELARISAFDYAPMICEIPTNDDYTSVTGVIETVGEVDNFAILDHVNIRNMNDTAVLSLWQAPIALLGQRR